MLSNFKLLHDTIEIIVYTIPVGESSKSREMKAYIEDFMFQNNCGRDTMILALGGGVVGDLSGFVAAAYMRGIPYVQIPTTFLAMVDSSIGNKTGINTACGKNLLGSFHNPKAVVIDVALLQSLPRRELINGLVESIKAGLIADEYLFRLIESNVTRILLKNDVDVLNDIIYRSVKIKVNIVLQDEKEIGLRSILNFGHSIGHAIEALVNGKLLHGECVAIGMMKEAKLAINRGYLNDSSSNVLHRLGRLLQSLELPVDIPAQLSVRDLLEKIGIDKKNKNGQKQLVMLADIGSTQSKPGYTFSVDDGDLIDILSPCASFVHDSAAKSTSDASNDNEPSNEVRIFGSTVGKGISKIVALSCKNRYGTKPSKDLPSGSQENRLDVPKKTQVCQQTVSENAINNFTANFYP
ncbi:unnamed protein product [Rotaria socialis]|nr:unnamed protein product [Rotaria socialis]